MDPLFRRVSLAAAIWAAALGLSAQTLQSTGSIHGTALDEQGSPLPGVEVKLQGAGERAPVQTDAQGKFRFLYISPGSYSVTLSLESVTARMYRAASSALYGEPYRTLDETLALIEAITAEEVAAVCRTFYDPSAQTVVSLGPTPAVP